MMDDDDDQVKKETGGSSIFLDLIEKTRKGAAVEKKVLEYNNKDPQSLLEQFMMPKERIQRKGDNPESEDVELNFGDIDSDFLKKIERNDFMAYCKENVKDRSYWGKKMTVDQILSYSKNINGPILALHGEVSGLAMKNFKRVVAIINEKVTKNAAVNIIKRMIKMAVKNSAEIRDEIFFQIIKQLRANYRQESLYQAWGLFCIISCFITPSESSVYPILNYIKKDVIEASRDDEVKKSARFVFVRILKGFLTRGRAVLPCSAEIELIRKKQKLSARINLFTGGYLTVFFENYTVISDILKQICEMMEIPKEHWPSFGLYEVTSKPGGLNEETYIEEFIKLADVLASWEHEKLFYQRKLGVNVEAKFTLYFKLRFQYPLDKTQLSDSLLLYNEACFLFKFCHCSLTDEELVELMGLHLQIFFGDTNDAKAEEIRKYLFEQIPNHEAKLKASREEIVVKILARYSEKKGKPRQECRLEFTEILSQKDSFARNLYTVKVDALSANLKHLKDNLVIGLGPKDIRIMTDKHIKQIDIDYFQIHKWGYSDVLFTLMFGQSDQQPSKLVFQTTLSTCIAHTMSTYCESLMGISPKENNLVVSATSKMIIAATEFFKRVNKFETARLDEEDSDEEYITEKEK